MSKIPIKQLFQNSRIMGLILIGFLLVVLGAFGIAYRYTVVTSSSEKLVFSGVGNGTITDPFQVTSCEQLQAISQQTNGFNYVLVNDLECTQSVNWNGVRQLESKDGTINGAFNGRIYRVNEQAKGLTAVLVSIPTFLAESIPYSLIFILLVIATLYSWQAMREYREIHKFHRNIAKIIETKEAINDYLAIISHNLVSLTTVMKSALELIISLKKTPITQAENIRSSVKDSSVAINELVVSNQVSTARSTNDEMIVKQKQLNPYKAIAVWLPGTILFGLMVITNGLFIDADLFNDSPLRILFEFGLFGIAFFLVGLSYKYRNFLKTTKHLARNQLETESELYSKRIDFLSSTSSIVEDFYQKIETNSSSLKKITESKLFFNSIDKAGQINKQLKKLKKFATFSSDAPLFDFSSYLKKEVHKYRELALEKNISIDANINSGVLSRIEPEEITQLIKSVLDNAIKYGKDGGKVEVAMFKRLNKILISVQDNGVGISEAKLATILKPLARGIDFSRSDYQGIGLELFSNKIITNKLGGHINVKSKLGEGTEVVIELPIVRNKKLLNPLLITPAQAAK